MSQQTALSNDMIDVLTFIEQMYWEEGSIPTDERVAEQTGIRLETLRDYWKRDEFRIALTSRGVDFVNLLDPNPRALTMQQLMVANAIMSIHDKRSMREKCKQLNISVQQVNAWMRQPAFQEHLRKRAEALYNGAEPIAYAEMVKAIEGGSESMIKFFFEMKGIYNPRVVHEVNITSVLIRVVEIVGKHVRDPAIMQAIGEEIESLDLTGSPQALPSPLPVGSIRI